MTCCALFALTLDTHILGPTMDILNIAAPALQFLAAINSTSKRLQDQDQGIVNRERSGTHNSP
jgi:hypothetical protein